MDTEQKTTDKRNKKPRTPSYKYSFRLTEEQNIRFNELLCKAGLERNRSRFIVKRLFAEEFIVLKRDPLKVQFLARLNDFYFQFQRIGNNYNQIVKAINVHFSNVAIPHQIAMLEQRTRELKALHRNSEPCKTTCCGMVANIRSGLSPGGALYYNKDKVDRNEAEVLFWQKMLELFD